MTCMRILGVCLGALFGVGVMTSSASAALPEFGPPAGAFTITSKAATFETVGKVKVKCVADTGKGEITGPKSVSIKIVFTGCTTSAIAGVKCQTPGSAPGEISTFGLIGELGYIELEPLKEVGLALSDPAAGIVTEFTCGPTVEILTGSVIAKVTPLNKPSKTITLKFVQKKGLQVPFNLFGEPPPPDILMNTHPEPVGLASGEPMKFAAPIVVIA